MERYVIKHYVELAFNGAVVIVTLLSGWHAWGTGQYLDGEQIPTLLYGFAGLMAFLFPHEFAGFSGSQGWRSTDWRFQPPHWVRGLGGVLLGVALWDIWRYV